MVLVSFLPVSLCFQRQRCGGGAPWASLGQVLFVDTRQGWPGSLGSLADLSVPPEGD